MGEVSVYEWILDGRIALWVRSARYSAMPTKAGISRIETRSVISFAVPLVWNRCLVELKCQVMALDGL